MSHGKSINPGRHSDGTGGQWATVLNRDILWLTFSMNGDMFSYQDALKTTRLSSQVCRDWRSVILETPSLWGKLIDLDLLDQKQDEWRDTVLRRSGDSSLSIKRSRPRKLHQFDVFPPQDALFLSILKQHWSQIERLSVNIDNDRIDAALWAAVIHPAPRLRVFEIAYNTTPIISNFGSLYANQAPLLEVFDAPEIYFRIPAPWLSNVNYLVIGPPFSLSETFEILKTTPLLQRFHLCTGPPSESDAIVVDIPSLALPYLRDIDFKGAFTSGVSLLGCLVNIHSVSLLKADLLYVPETNHDDLKASLQVLSRITRDYFRANTPTAVSLIIYFSLFYLKAENTGAGSHFSLGLHRDPWEMESITPFFLSAFSTTHFNTVIELNLTFNQDSIDEYIPAFRSFFSSFSSVRLLTLNKEGAIRHIYPHPQEGSEILFPMLDTLKYSRFQSPFFAEEPIRKFVVARREAGHPISALDVTEYYTDIKQAVASMGALEDLRGLTVLWRRPGAGGVSEHVCGSGDL